jgi:hypothetical protein
MIIDGFFLANVAAKFVASLGIGLLVGVERGW